MIYFLFLLTFWVFVYTLFPSVAIYRDAGEMVSVCYKYGIAHPPGYPLYVVLGKIFTILIPFGNIAYRVNCMSAVFGALTCSIIYLIIKQLTCSFSIPQSHNPAIPHSLYSTIPQSHNPAFLLSACLPVLIFAFSKTLWSVSVVAEMYTLNIFFIVLIIYLLLTTRYLLLVSFLLGLATGNRIEIILIVPGILYWVVKSKIQNLFSIKNIITYVILFFLGFSIFAFLPARSKTQPYLNWNKPDNIQTVMDTITRKTHGKTLDLISTRYKISDVFYSGMKVYLERTFNLFTIIGIPIVFFGFLYLYKAKKDFLISTLMIYIITGPFFITIAKMPPNPYALAIVEPHYLISDLMLALWFGFGIYFVSRKLKTVSIIFLIIPIWLFTLNIGKQNMRNNFTAYDFARNVFRSLPANSIIISREDIQVFSEWYLQYVENKRNDITVIAKGLSGSKWYQETLKKYKNTDVFSLNNPDTFSQFYIFNKNRNVCFTSDVEDYEMLGQKYYVYPYGLVFQVKDIKTVFDKPVNFVEFYIKRSVLNASAYPDFFTQKIISQYADSLFKAGLFFMREDKEKDAIIKFNEAISIKEDYPSIYYNLGWLYYQKNDLEKTEYYYKESIKYYTKMYNDAIEYKSFPEVVDSILYDWAIVYNNLGTIYEKQNKTNEAISEYNEAVKIKSDYMDAHYNMAVAYWRLNKWDKVIEELEKTLKINPNNIDAQKYLYMARKNAQIHE
ncbi:MAG: DUF2723 domain-containing protein [Elusimicrobia bacterium]|nr:DUF2723 domain-containing protein [Elusimicrobiota bacterium]